MSCVQRRGHRGRISAKQIDNTTEAARLHKILKKDKTNGIGFLKTESVISQIQDRKPLTFYSIRIFRTAFQSEKTRRGKHQWCPFFTLLENLLIADQIISEEKIIWAIKSFKPFKSPGGMEYFQLYATQMHSPHCKSTKSPIQSQHYVRLHPNRMEEGKSGLHSKAWQGSEFAEILPADQFIFFPS